MQDADKIEKKVQDQLEKISEKVPEPVKGFIHENGKIMVGGLVAILALLILWRYIKSLGKHGNKRKNKPIGSEQWKANALEVNLARIKPPAFPPGKKRATIKGEPVRFGVAILAKAGGNGPEPTEEQLESILNYACPGLGEIAMRDYPKVHVWEAQYSPGGFTQLFNQNVRIPDARGQKSRWITASGIVRLGPDKIHLGLALLADTPNLIRTINLNNDQWLDILRID